MLFTSRGSGWVPRLDAARYHLRNPSVTMHPPRGAIDILEPQGMYKHGWYHIAHDGDLTSELTPIEFGTLRLMCVRTPQGIGVYDAICPHRGAHLAYGGQLADEHVLCPFHGYKIRLGTPVGQEFCVRPYPTLTVGGMVFFRLSDAPTPDLPAFLEQFGQS
ncbi:MAG: Rieske 2Fe-2S domain-containing protein, partial [Pirellulaceae bacterium]